MIFGFLTALDCSPDDTPWDGGEWISLPKILLENNFEMFVKCQVLFPSCVLHGGCSDLVGYPWWGK